MPYLCDLPYQTFDSAMRHISKTFKDVYKICLNCVYSSHLQIDYIIITGDFEAHDSWDYTEDLTRENMNNMTNVFLEYFPNIPVYVSIGNHEGVPQDAYVQLSYEKKIHSWVLEWLHTPCRNMIQEDHNGCTR